MEYGPLTALVFQEIWPDDFVVGNDRAVILNWQHAPDEEQTLQQEVEGDERCQETGEEFQNGEDRIQDPVCQPLGIVHFGARLNRFD